MPHRAGIIRLWIVLVCDEVREAMIFDAARRHCSPLGLPDLCDRSVKIGSAGKIFYVKQPETNYVRFCFTKDLRFWTRQLRGWAGSGQPTAPEADQAAVLAPSAAV